MTGSSGNTGQLPLEFPHRPALARRDFLVAPSNHEAYAWIDRWPDWPSPALAVCGPAGCGKTHLASIWQARSGAVPLSPARLAEDPRIDAGPPRALLLDVADWNSTSPAAEAALLHLYNNVAQEGAHLLLCARSAPARWPIALPDLQSRLAAVPVARMALPEDELVAALVRKLFADRQIAVPQEVIAYLVPRMERSFEAVHRVVAAIDRDALAARRAVTLPLAREALTRLQQG